MNAAILERLKVEFGEGNLLVSLLDPEKVSPLFNRFSCSVFSRKNCLVYFLYLPCLIWFMMSKWHFSRLCSLSCFDFRSKSLAFCQSLSTEIACYVILLETCVGVLIFSRVCCIWFLCHKSKIARNMPVPFYFIVGYPQFVLSDHVNNVWSIFEKILRMVHKKQRDIATSISSSISWGLFSIFFSWMCTYRYSWYYKIAKLKMFFKVRVVSVPDHF